MGKVCLNNCWTALRKWGGAPPQIRIVSWRRSRCCNFGIIIVFNMSWYRIPVTGFKPYWCHLFKNIRANDERCSKGAPYRNLFLGARAIPRFCLGFSVAQMRELCENFDIFARIGLIRPQNVSRPKGILCPSTKNCNANVSRTVTRILNVTKMTHSSQHLSNGQIGHINRTCTRVGIQQYGIQYASLTIPCITFYKSKITDYGIKRH